MKERERGIPNWHPLKVGPDGVHLTLVNADLGSNVQEGIFGVVQSAESVSVAVVGNFYTLLASDHLIPEILGYSPWSSQIGIQAKC